MYMGERIYKNKQDAMKLFSKVAQFSVCFCILH